MRTQQLFESPLNSTNTKLVFKKKSISVTRDIIPYYTKLRTVCTSRYEAREIVDRDARPESRLSRISIYRPRPSSQLSKIISFIFIIVYYLSSSKLKLVVLTLILNVSKRQWSPGIFNRLLYKNLRHFKILWNLLLNFWQNLKYS